MSKKRTPQARYQAALAQIKRRTGASHAEAQHAYRIARTTDTRAKFPTYWKELRKGSAQYIARRARSELELPTRPRYRLTDKAHITGLQRALFQGADFSFDIRDLMASDVENRLARVTVPNVTLEVTVELFKRGRSMGTKTITRENVSTRIDDFWFAYHDAVREGLETEYVDGQGGDEPFSIVTHEITILE